MRLLKENIPYFFLRLPVFYIFGWLIHIITISVVAFFHFRLGHRLIVIENWILDLAWPINLFSKSVALILFFKFFYEGRIKNLQDIIFNRKNLIPSFHSTALVVMNLLFFVAFARPFFADNVLFDVERLFMHTASIVGTFLIDLVIILIIETESRNKNYTVAKILYTSVIVFMYFLACFPMVKDLPLSILFMMGLNFSYFFFFRRSVTTSLLFISVVVVPLYTLLGFDPVWENKFSLFKTNLYSINLHSFCLMLAFSGYFYFIYKKRSSA